MYNNCFTVLMEVMHMSELYVSHQSMCCKLQDDQLVAAVHHALCAQLFFQSYDSPTELPIAGKT